MRAQFTPSTVPSTPHTQPASHKGGRASLCPDAAVLPQSQKSLTMGHVHCAHVYDTANAHVLVASNTGTVMHKYSFYEQELCARQHVRRRALLVPPQTPQCKRVVAWDCTHPVRPLPYSSAPTKDVAPLGRGQGPLPWPWRPPRPPCNAAFTRTCMMGTQEALTCRPANGNHTCVAPRFRQCL